MTENAGGFEVKMCLHNPCLHCGDEDSTPQLWRMLEDLYLGNNLTTVFDLQRESYQLKMVEGGNLTGMFNGFVDQLVKLMLRKKIKPFYFLPLFLVRTII